MEEHKPSDSANAEKEAAIEVVPSTPKKVVVRRKPAVRKPIVDAAIIAPTLPAEVPVVVVSESETQDDAPIENETAAVSKKLDKKNLKKLKKMSDKIKEKEQKAKSKQKEKEKKAKKKKKEKAKKEKAQKKLKEKKAKKKAAEQKKKAKRKAKKK